MYRLGDKLLSRDEISARVEELADRINRDYEGRELCAVCVLKGAFVFFADLVRRIRVPLLLDFMAVSSYGVSTVSSGVVKITKDLDLEITGKDVLLVDDIVDSGLTLDYIKRVLLDREPKSLEICVLLEKPERRKIDFPVKYVGFSIPDRFVVGYGLDVAGLYRNLPDIHVVEKA